MSGRVQISVIVPVSERYDNIRELYFDYKNALESLDFDYECIYVLDGEFKDIFEQLKLMQTEGEQIRIIQLAKSFGEATALTVGFEHSHGQFILTLPAYYQVDPSELPKLLKEINNFDMIVVRRWPRVDSRFNRFQTRMFHWILNFIMETPYRDLGCGVRVFSRQIANEVPLYGDQHRFLPLLASRQGFKIKEVEVTQSSRDRYRRVYRAGVYPRRLLDILTVFFLVKFTKKPLRFFGLIGSFTFLIGSILSIYLVIERLFFSVSLADRPALLLSSLLVVLGVQIFALGLIGELIIFTHAKNIKEYSIDKIIN